MQTLIGHRKVRKLIFLLLVQKYKNRYWLFQKPYTIFILEKIYRSKKYSTFQTNQI